MRLRRLVLPVLVLLAPLNADAGIGSAIVKAASSLGKTGAKAGKLGKGAAAFQGAKALGTGVAAQRVFASVADDGARVGMYVAEDGAGAFKVVMQGGEEITQTQAGLKSMVRDYDEMAAVAPDAGVDVYVDPDLIPKLADLDLGPNTRLFLANTEGASLPIRQGADDVVEVAVARRPDATGRVWLQLGTESAKLALRLSSHAARADRVVVADEDCEDVGGTLVAPGLEEGLVGARGTVVVLTDQPVNDDAIWLAQRHDIDLVVLGLDEICPPGEGPMSDTSAYVARADTAMTHGDLWSIAATGPASGAIDRVLAGDEWLILNGAGLTAVHRIFEPESDDPPLWFVLLALLVGCIAVVVKFRGLVTSNERTA